MEPTIDNTNNETNTDVVETTEHEHEAAATAGNVTATAQAEDALLVVDTPTSKSEIEEQMTAATADADTVGDADASVPIVADGDAVQEIPPVERVFDFAFGVGLLTAESLSTLGERLNEATQQMQTQAPEFIRDMQEKGRPVRERVLSDLKSNLFAPLRTPDGDLATGVDINDPDLTDSDAFDGTDEDGNRLGVPMTDTADSQRTSWPSKSAFAPSKPLDSAEAEIQRLEDRVRQLEEQTEATTMAAASPTTSADLSTGATATDVDFSAPAPGTIESDDDKPKPETTDGGNI